MEKILTSDYLNTPERKREIIKFKYPLTLLESRQELGDGSFTSLRYVRSFYF